MVGDLTALRRDVLYVIGGLDDESPPYGLAIKQELDQHYANEINHGRLYLNLNELAGMGLVEKGGVDNRTNSYGLTEHGYREVEARWEWEDQYVGVEV